mmetsp:Transcript_103885/g.332982  ORF Transcript_103885/g.332982 Transcript_103885/m.332982 type:complete len:202 (-) Transcript_103885:10-615(-)
MFFFRACETRAERAHFSGQSNSSLSMASWSAMGLQPSTVQPTALQVPSTSLTVPLNSLAKLLGLICRTMSKSCTFVKLPLCLMFLVFLRSRNGSFSCLMTKLVAFGSTSTLAARFWMVRRTVTRMPFHVLVPFTMSSPTFFGDMPRGPTFGASTDEGACSPPYWRSVTIFVSLASNLGAMAASAAAAAPRRRKAGGWVENY